MNAEEAKLALQIGYFILLLYCLRRGFNLADSAALQIGTKLDQLIQIERKKKPLPRSERKKQDPK